MNQYALLCLDNNPISIEQLRSELSVFTSKFDVHCADSIEDAHCALQYCLDNNQPVALVIASHHESFDGASFLIQLDKSPLTKSARKILVSCGQDIQAILSAVNEGRLDHCLTKPLQDNLVYKTVQKELTTFVVEHDKENLLSYSLILEQQRLLRAHIDQKMASYQAGFISDHHRLSDAQLAEQVIDALSQFFADNDENHAIRQYSSDHLLTIEGDENRFLWFITSGEVALYKKDELGMQREVVRHSKGNLVGGMSFVTGEPSFSTAITLTDTQVIKLDRDEFSQVMQSNTALLPLFTNLLLRHFNRRLQRSINTKLTLQKTLESLESAHQQLIEREKMAMLGQLVAGVAHELNNPIAAILRGTDTLTENIHQLVVRQNNSSEYQGDEILTRALSSRPSSTADERLRTKEAEQKMGDRRLAKKLVKLGLENDRLWIERIKRDKDQATADLIELENFHLTGATLRSINVCAQRIADMVKSLKGYARADDETFHSVDIHEGIEDTLVIFENKLKLHKVVKHYSDLPSIRCLPIALQQVWTNLISNAIDAFPDNGCLTITTRIAIREGKHWAVVEIKDNGCGISKALQQQIFALNFTTKREGNFGLGIGLSVCQQIIQQHGGTIEVESIVEQYTKMSVWLPIEAHA
ncbi:ATP-binding protein [Vibrio renipiscarius]|uniref:histidine kinase n=1 Tax=Vibrio renipiscarius TaxID=1461322 RepID=A0A0C2NNU8_9VIBR|nr:ATP-binding protein [Vibrio renipiscarius]KII75727.1 ATPase [Vibrio renipiscarius]KII81823.1 ATPase [Vibrio renipiscarius]